MKIWLATTNNNKIKEIVNFLQLYFQTNSKKIFQNKQLDISLQSLIKLKKHSSPEETGSSFRQNAKIKSEHLLQCLIAEDFLKNSTGILAEDSGLELESLKGEPGIHSARYSGPQADDKKNNQLLLKNLKHHKNRKARYVCALSFVFINQGQRINKTFEAYCEGLIAHQARGKRGFGYDPLFIPKNQPQTLGDAPLHFKQKVSHRRKALEKWLNFMEKPEISSAIQEI